MNYLYILLNDCLHKKKYIKLYFNNEIKSHNTMNFSKQFVDKEVFSSTEVKDNKNNINKYNIICNQCNSLITNDTTIFCLHDKLFCTIKCRNIFYKIGKK